MTETLIIAPRFCGPPGSGHGGYVCGRIAAYLDAPATVTLRRPPPLATAMTVELDHTATVRVRADGTLIAEAVTTPDAPARDAPARDAPAPDLPGPAPGLPDPAPGLPGSVSMAEARAAGAGSRVRTHPDEHPFPGCFACGPDRAPGDGLRVMVGPVVGRDLSADVWHPDQTLAGPDGQVRPEFVWSALDCAGGVALANAVPSELPYVLGRFSVRQLVPVRTGEPYVVTGWRIAEDGRKLTAGSALFTAVGQPVGTALATWIRLRDPAPRPR